MAQNLSGQTLKGYDLVEQIGKGGFGAVYRAYQPLIKRDVALKVILPEHANTPEFVRRFEAEAQLVANLEHPYIVPLYDYWRDAEGAFLVMRWLRGGSVKDVLQQGQWPLKDIPRVLDQITGALAVAHRHGVVHRDIKPENVLLDEDNNAYLADFGIAMDTERITDSATFIQSLEAGRLIGSPEFMSPEQIQLAPVTPQTDIYALGILLYMMLTGHRPFENADLSTIITKHLYDSLPHIREFRPDLPEELNEVIETATQKSPEERYDDVIALAAAFRRALEQTGDDTIDNLERMATADVDLSDLQSTETFTGWSGIFEQATQALHLEPENPYKGLRAFQEADADDFFGRAEQVSKLQARLQEPNQRGRFIALVGPSGSGKSSLVRAGLLPALRQGDKWFITDMTPGNYPLEELEAALLRVAVNPPPSLMEQLERDERGLCRAARRILPGGDDAETELLLFIDQFEEVFTQVEDEGKRVAFLNLLRAAAADDNSRLRVVLTIRADLYDRPLMYPEFGALVRECTEVILPLSRDELQDAVRKPAERVQLALEDSLVADIVADVSQQPGMLPMMQYALTELFERREGNLLTTAAYQEIGGVSGALARRADDLYTSLDDTSQTIARQVFLRLVALGDGTKDTRRRTLLSELLSLDNPEQVQQVIDQFGKYRLLTFDHDPTTRAPTVEIAHEALIQQWEQLRHWLDDSRDDLRTQRRLIQAAREWQQSEQDPSFLLTGTRLVQFEEWRSQTTLRLTENETQFLDASLARRDEEARQEAERAAREAALERRSRRVLRALAAVMSVAAVVALALSLFAFNQRNTAITNANAAATARAQAQVNEQRARTLAFTSGAQAALAQGDTDLALVLGIQAAELSPDSTQVMRTLAEVAYTPGTRRVFEGHSDRVQEVAYSPDGTTAVSAGDRGEVVLWDVATGDEIRRFEGHDPLYRESGSDIEEEKVNIVYDVAFSPDGSQILTGAEDKSVILWDAATGDIVRRLEGHADVVKAVAFAPDGQTALSGSHDRNIIHWDLNSGDILNTFGADDAGHTDWVNDIAFSESGFTALSGSADGSVILWNIASGQRMLQFRQGDGDVEIYTIRYTPDELGFMAGASDGTLRLWSFEAGQPIRAFDGHTDRVTGISFSPDGTEVVTSSQDDSIIRWDFNTGNPLQRYHGHTDRVYGIAFSPVTKNHFLSAGWDKTLRLWDTQNGAQTRQITTHDAETRALAISPDGTYVASGSEDGVIHIRNTNDPEADLIPLTLQPTDCDPTAEVETDRSTFAVRDLVFSPQGDTLISGSRDGEIREWDVQSGAVVRCLGANSGGHSDIVYAVDVHPSGEQLISGSRDNSIIFWDLETGEQIGRYFEHTFHILDVAYSPDGRLAVSAGRDANVLLWNTESFEVERRFTGHDDWVFTASFSNDGEQVLSGGAENELILWDVPSGQPLRTLEGHDSFIHTAAFSPDGQHAISGSADGQMLLWNVTDGTELQRISGHTDDVRRLQFTGDVTVLSASDDGAVRLWTVQSQTSALLDWIDENRYVRDPRCGERELYDIPPLCPPPTPVLDDGTV